MKIPQRWRVNPVGMSIWIGLALIGLGIYGLVGAGIVICTGAIGSLILGSIE